MSSQWKLNQALARHLALLIESRHGIGMKDLMVLGHIRAGVQYPTELADALQMPRHMASRVIDELLKGSWIERRIDEADSRRTRLSVSPAGQSLLEDTRATVDGALELLFGQIPSQERAQVLTAFETLAQAAQTAFGSRP